MHPLFAARRAVMHRATPFAGTTKRRHMVRTTDFCAASVN
jgi:hypothetical protein